MVQQSPKSKNRIEKKFGIKINDDPILAINQRSKILKIRKSVLELPMRALISPFNKHTLNEKLYIFSTADVIKDYKLEIARNSLKKRDIRFTAADINNIRRAVIWLNWFMFDETLEKKPATLKMFLCAYLLMQEQYLFLMVLTDFIRLLNIRKEI